MILSFGPRISCDGVPHESFVAGLSDVPVTTEHDGEQARDRDQPRPARRAPAAGRPDARAHQRGDSARGHADRAHAARGAGRGTRTGRPASRGSTPSSRAGCDAGPEPHPGVRAACAQLAATGGTTPVGALAAELGWSRRHLGARFRDEVGVAPKTYARLVRFERAAALLARPEPDLAEVALGCGYYDQAHFNREFRALAGVAPGRFRAERLPNVQDPVALAA